MCHIFEEKMKKDLSAIHPEQLIFNTTNPGLDSAIGFLDQNSIVLENYLVEDPDADYYEEL